MGTFHNNLGELHGITVAVETTGNTVYVGRCHEANDTNVIMLDVDEHAEGDDGQTNAQYLEKAARWGVFKKRDHLVIPRAQVTTIRPLNELSS